jgi:DNA-binding GntR family transcriptional regulator
MVTDALRQLITDRELSPGTPLRQRQIAALFDVSYTPVREALRRLESEGLVVTDVHRGATVAGADSEELEEAYRILAALESLAGSLAVSKITEDDIAEIDALYRGRRPRAGRRPARRAQPPVPIPPLRVRSLPHALAAPPPAVAVVPARPASRPTPSGVSASAR